LVVFATHMEESNSDIAFPQGTQGRPRKRIADGLSGHIDKVLEFRLKGLTHADIGKFFKVTAAAVTKRLHKIELLLRDPELTEGFRRNEARLLDSARMQILSAAITKINDKKTTFGNLAYGYRQLFDATQLLRGKPTATVHALTAIISKAHGKSTTKDKEEAVDVTDHKM